MRLSEGEEMSQSVNMEPGVYEFLMGSDWPGNVRELENAAARAKAFKASKDRLQRVDFDFLLGESKRTTSRVNPRILDPLVPWGSF